ncbi:hypothetical protein LX36DRAFT_187124 [Colletotrichum falcatum]|nr:hypothetical protein LX36DRAFT_187124 [Colletotrichum falcatum]
MPETGLAGLLTVLHSPRHPPAEEGDLKVDEFWNTYLNGPRYRPRQHEIRSKEMQRHVGHVWTARASVDCRTSEPTSRLVSFGHHGQGPCRHSTKIVADMAQLGERQTEVNLVDIACSSGVTFSSPFFFVFSSSASILLLLLQREKCCVTFRGLLNKGKLEGF